MPLIKYRKVFSVLILGMSLISTVMLGSESRVLVSADTDPMNPGIDIVKFEAALKSTGVEGWVHGRLGELAVFVYRENDFFHYAQFPIVSHIPGVRESLLTLARHDRVMIKGQFIENGAPQKHIYVTELNIVERWDGGGGESVAPYEYSAKLPEDLLNGNTFVGKVHFASIDGSVVVCEYKDAVIPVPGIPGKTNGLFRGDKIRVHYKIASHPTRPAHLVLDEASQNPLEVLSHIQDLHGKEAIIEGTVVKFPKSPDVAFDVFALQTTDSDFVTLDYTLVNFESPAVFKAIREKLGAAWTENNGTVVSGRNKLHNPRLKIKARGTLNMVAPSQANPQILLKGPEDVTIVFE